MDARFCVIVVCLCGFVFVLCCVAMCFWSVFVLRFVVSCFVDKFVLMLCRVVAAVDDVLD